ncbi:MAG: small multi-drug export protein [Firmicutes bacterium]|nr:small multi-drug export protein [Bacillota bacterium]
MFKTILYTFFISMVPVIELRGAIPAGVAGGLPVFSAALIAIVGNMVPVPFVLLFTRSVLAYMEKRNKLMQSLAAKVRAKAEKNRGKVERYKFWGLVLLVAIPLPGTGAWTGAIVAALLDEEGVKATFAILLGVLIAAVIVSLITTGVIALN